MSPSSTAREALIAELIGDMASLVEEIKAVAPVMNDSCRTMLQAGAALRDEAARFETRVISASDAVKVQAINHIAARSDEAARQTIDQQTRAMADAARIAFGAELGATMQRLQVTLQPLLQRQHGQWRTWLSHAAVAIGASGATWACALLYCCGPR